LGRILRYAQWPSYFDPVLEAFRRDTRIRDVRAPLIGHDVKQIINQLHWKPPGAEMVEFGYHQDVRSRRPRSAYRDLARSYVQTGIAIDPHRHDNGAMTVYPGIQALGELPLDRSRSAMSVSMSETDLERIGLDPARIEM